MLPKTIKNRLEFHPLKDEEQGKKYNELREAYILLAELIYSLTPVTREQSLAFTHLEQSLMFSIASIARNE